MRQLVRLASSGVLVALALALLAPAAGAQAPPLRPGDLIVLDAFGGTTTLGSVFHVDPATGAQTEISADGLFDDPAGVAVGPDSQIYVTNCGCVGPPSLIRVDPATGKTSFVFSCFNQDQPLDCVDFPGLAARLAQNSLQEKLTAQWIDRCLVRLRRRAAAA